jgi:hypothetical protein
VKSNINSVEVHPQPSKNGHLVDGVLMGAGSLWTEINMNMYFSAMKFQPTGYYYYYYYK